MSGIIPLPSLFTIDNNATQMWSGYARQYEEESTLFLHPYTGPDFENSNLNPFRISEDLYGNFHLRGVVVANTNLVSTTLVINFNLIPQTTPLIARLIKNLRTTYGFDTNQLGIVGPGLSGPDFIYQWDPLALTITVTPGGASDWVTLTQFIFDTPLYITRG